MRVALLSKSDTQVLTSICDSGVTFAYKHKVQQISDTNNISMVIEIHHIKWYVGKDRVWSKYWKASAKSSVNMQVQ